MTSARTGFCLGLLLLLNGCNVYAPFASPGSDAEYIEEARRCLATSDYDCAIANYSRIAETALKNQKLCLANISKAGMNLTSLVSVATSGSSGSSLLKLTANQILLRGYTQAKLDAAASAVTQCALLGSDQTSTLLKLISLITDCGVRLAKSDTLVATSEGGATTCNSATAGNGNRVMDDADIGGSGAGVVDGSNSGMCEADVQACVNNMNAAGTLGGGLAGSTGLSALASNANAAAALLGSGTGTAVVQAARVSLKGNI
jgi:hypothetical protein